MNIISIKEVIFMFFNISENASAHIKGGKEFPKIDGNVTFKETEKGVLLTAKIHGLPQSKTHCKR